MAPEGFQRRKAQLAALCARCAGAAAPLRPSAERRPAGRRAVQQALLLARLRRGPDELRRLRCRALRHTAQQRAALAGAALRLAQAQADLSLL